MNFPFWLRCAPARYVHRAHLENVLGTSLELQIVATKPEIGLQVEVSITDEIDRLEAIFSVYQTESEFNLWQQTQNIDVAVSPELAEVLERSESWRISSHGAFNPAVEALTQIWKRAQQIGDRPDVGELRVLADEMAAPLWRVDRENLRARRLTQRRASLNSVAKGFIIDRACELARSVARVEDILVNIGGDLRHSGAQSLPVNIADPFTRADNAPPLARVRIGNASLATSGRARRGFQVGERWFSHVIDPRDGQPVSQTVSASVVANNALDADALATICSVIAPTAAIEFADSLENIAVCLVSESGEIARNPAWRALEVGN